MTFKTRYSQSQSSPSVPKVLVTFPILFFPVLLETTESPRGLHVLSIFFGGGFSGVDGCRGSAIKGPSETLHRWVKGQTVPGGRTGLYCGHLTTEKEKIESLTGFMEGNHPRFDPRTTFLSLDTTSSLIVPTPTTVVCSIGDTKSRRVSQYSGETVLKGFCREGVMEVLL